MASSVNKLHSLGCNIRWMQREISRFSTSVSNTRVTIMSKTATPTLDQIAPPEPNFPLPGQTTTLLQYRLSKLPDTLQNKSTPLHKNAVLADRTAREHQMQAVREFAEASHVDCESKHQQMKCNVIDAPFVAKRELVDLFPDRATSVMESPLSMLTLSYRTEHDMSAWSYNMECERDSLFGSLVDTGNTICESLRSEGYWADFIDPASGRPYAGPFTNATLFETDSRYRHMGMEVEDLGCCKVLTHPVFGRHAFVGVVFTDAPHDSPFLRSIASKLNE